MTWPYSAGSATPNYSGLFELPDFDLRICDVASGGTAPTFHPLVIPPIVSSAPFRQNVMGVPRGAYVADPIFDSWQFDVTGWFLMDDVDDVGAAFAYLCDAVKVANGWMAAHFNDPSWSAARLMTVRKSGPITYAENPDKGEMGSGYREFVIPLIAADPLKYSLTTTDTVIGTGTTVTNNGNAKVTHVVRFDGPNTDHIQVAVNGSSDDALVYLGYALGSGEWIEINTRDASYVTNTGVDMNPYFYVGSVARLLAPGGNSATKSSGSGGTATIKHYDGWE